MRQTRGPHRGRRRHRAHLRRSSGAQESLANIHRHSGSRRTRIARSPARVTLVVSDEGRGLRKIVGRRPGDPALMGVGIAGMRERVRQLGGEIVIDSSTRGTAVKVMLPLVRKR